jgi:hypothetical protein
MNTNPIAAALSSISLGPEVTFENLTMIPLLKKNPERSRLAPPASRIEYLILDDALASGTAEITEVSEHGSVPQLKIVNRGKEPVLIVDGEELVGAKQNRVVNLTILVAAQAKLTIPVSCVEAGRWRARSRAFTAAPRAQFAKGRAKRMAQVTCSIRDRGDRMSDQAQVWADISEKSARMGAHSSTSAMGAIFERHSTSIDAYVDACKPVDGQVGAVFTIDGTAVGFDLFDDPATLRKLLPKLVRSAAVEAIDAPALAIKATRDSAARNVGHAGHVARTVAEQFLAVASSAPQQIAKGVGLGDDVRLSAPGIAGAALVVNQEVVHIAAFAL